MQIGFLSKVGANIHAMKSQFAPEAVQILGSKEALAEAIADLEVLIAMNQDFQQFTIDS